MPDMKLAITAVEYIIGTVIAIALGDYLGYKIGRMRLAIILGIIALAIVVLFTIYAAVVLA
ncbi:MAG: hypothetical protein PHR43_00690 [Dehalococcoidales bacterium]|nr:hypothetical protein [Dehalococcoidales bacterium]